MNNTNVFIIGCLAAIVIAGTIFFCDIAASVSKNMVSMVEKTKVFEKEINSMKNELAANPIPVNNVGGIRG